jgi:hypothetical protein
MPFVFAGQSNDTCDVYRSGQGPGGVPAVAGVKIYVVPRFRNIKGNFAGLFAYTHVLYVPLNTDIRDGWNGFAAIGGDTLFLPNGGTTTWRLKLIVQFVCRRRASKQGQSDFLEVYCQSSQANYPTPEG